MMSLGKRDRERYRVPLHGKPLAPREQGGISIFFTFTNKEMHLSKCCNMNVK